LPQFEARSSLRTWVLRIAHNVAASHIARSIRHRSRQTESLVALEDGPDDVGTEEAVDRRALIERIAAFVRGLRPIDRQVLLLYLEGIDQREIGEITGITTAHVSTK